MDTYFKSFVDDYLDQESPETAILVSGPWGVGKTFLVRQYISDFASNNYKFLYVSLFGINSVEEAHAAVVSSSLHPSINVIGGALEEIDLKSIDTIVPGLPSIFLSIGEHIGKHVLRNRIGKSHVIVFDDLERCALNLKEIMGVFAFYLEQRGCKIILIANEDEISKNFDQYPSVKEKIVGRAVQITPQIDNAYSSFILSYKSPIEEDFFKNFKTKILELYTQSGCQSLRVLKQLIWGLSRFINFVDKKYVEHEEVFSELICLFCAFDIELQMGRLSPTDLFNRTRTVENYFSVANEVNMDDRIVPNIITSSNRFLSVDLLSDTLSDQALNVIFVSRSFDERVISNSIDTSKHFLSSTNSFPWRILVNFTNYEDTLLEEAVTQMESCFKNRVVTIYGEMLHLFSLRMLYSEAGMIEFPVTVVEEQCMDYVNDIRENGGIDVKDRMQRGERDDETGYDNVGFYVKDTYIDSFYRVREHLRNARCIAEKQYYNNIGENVIHAMKNDFDMYKINFHGLNLGDQWYNTMSAFTSIDSKQFVNTWLGMPTVNWDNVLHTLIRLFAKSDKRTPSFENIRWLRDVILQLELNRGDFTGMSAIRIAQLISSLQLRFERYGL